MTLNVAAAEPGLKMRSDAGTSGVVPDGAIHERDGLGAPSKTALAVDLSFWRVLTRSTTTPTDDDADDDAEVAVTTAE